MEPDLALQALADPTRRDIVTRVLGRERSVSALARQYPMSFAAVQKHIAILERAGLVAKRRNGRERLVSADIEALRRVDELFDHFETVWRQRIQQFGDVLAGTTTPQGDNP